MRTKKTMKLMSWNVDDWRIKRAGKNKLKLDRQIDAIAKVRADIVALQEVSSAVAEYFKEKLSKIGLEYVETSHQFDGPSQYGVILASRWPLKIQPSFFDIPWQKCSLSAIVKSNHGEIELHTVHVPNGRNHRCRKIDTFNGIHDALSQKSKRHRILCGDFNSPDKEFIDGQVIKVITFDKENEKCDAITGQNCERQVICGLAKYDLKDNYLKLREQKDCKGPPEYSHINNKENEDGEKPKRRLDHIFSSSSLNPKKCDYLHSLRKENNNKYLSHYEKGDLSDHSPVCAVYEPKILRPPIKKKM